MAATSKTKIKDGVLNEKAQIAWYKTQRWRLHDKIKMKYNHQNDKTKFNGGHLNNLFIIKDDPLNDKKKWVPTKT